MTFLPIKPYLINVTMVCMKNKIESCISLVGHVSAYP